MIANGAAMNFVVLTDTHFVAAGQMLYGLDPAARLAAAIRAINRDHGDIACTIVMGDLAHWGERAAYEHLREVLKELRALPILMLGNHDRRLAFRSAFSAVADDGRGFIQSVHRFEAATIVTLDTLDERAVGHEGVLCDDRLAFLAGALESASTDRPLLLFQHHPPFDTGLPAMDRIKLRNGEAQWAVIERTRRPDYLFTGHLHRPIAGVWRGIPFHVQRGINHQVAFDLVTADHIPGTHEAPDYSLVLVTGREIVIQQCSFLYDGPVYSLEDSTAQLARSVSELRR